MKRILSILVVFAALLFVVPRAFATPPGSAELGDEQGDGSAVAALYEGAITVEMGGKDSFELKADESNLAPVITENVRDRDIN